MSIHMTRQQCRELGITPITPRKRSGQMTATAKILFQSLCQQHGLPVPVPEYRFHPTRQWKFDFAFVNDAIALEIDGGAWSNGRHVRGKGFIEDMEKSNEAQIMGWTLIRCTPQQVTDGSVCHLLKRALEAKRG